MKHKKTEAKTTLDNTYKEQKNETIRNPDRAALKKYEEAQKAAKDAVKGLEDIRPASPKSVADRSTSPTQTPTKTNPLTNKRAGHDSGSR
jgi:hypothetical protein